MVVVLVEASVSLVLELLVVYDDLLVVVVLVVVVLVKASVALMLRLVDVGDIVLLDSFLGSAATSH